MRKDNYTATKKVLLNRGSPYAIPHSLHRSILLKVETDFKDNGEQMSENCFFTSEL